MKDSMFLYEFDLFRYSKDLTALSFLLLIGSSLTVHWVSLSMSSSRDLLHYLVLPLILVVILHEGLHALTAKLSGAKTSLGVLTKYGIILAVYVGINTPLPVKKIRYITIAPIIISIVAFFFSWVTYSPFWAILYIFNTTGIVGDLIVFLVLSKMPSDAIVVDEGTIMKSNAEFPEPYPSWFSKLIIGLAVLVFLYILTNIRIEFEVVGTLPNQTMPVNSHFE
ncbi:hypothetical protein PFDSM3638_09420 [Pyrococcus furiosus DSM 3638]|uniref:DUF3267 domain-containing protein n=2 Tax=Pyrococcus furiosus (strain ATCC 43587 / DSM 3638 / JCM 8422 / Vc1) TaxID=186497 RepID=Q8TZV5_PYRFU|nr:MULTISPECIES: DUF3267 domain-containing protein [Pyrococcus]AAL81997.1 hypothetical protein PF1873 [Pyrococcus furiosus DSM 3638]MDK2870301.1 hypothetical protein [Pyrococcus sp.]QEK79471.1 hypothetical protein PFDSM3638_09420 [Pyrococcus furiosus DSM 3638]